MLKELTVAYQTEPIGLDLPPRFSWKYETREQDLLQAAYQIIVKKAELVVWDSGLVASEESILVPYNGTELQPMTQYTVSIKAWDNKGQCHEANTYFETGLLNQNNWQASWITHTIDKEKEVCPIFCKNIPIDKSLVSARLYATACGVYEVAVNGKKVDDTFLAPGWTTYHERLQYQTYDLTKALSGTEGSDEKCLEVTVGSGWYRGYLNGEGEKAFYGDRVALLAMLKLTYSDGSVDYIGTDGNWEVCIGPIQDAEIYHGETQFLTEKQTYVCNAVLFDTTKKVKSIVAQESEPVRIVDRLPAKDLIITPKGEVVIDFGQNMSGFVEVKLPKIRSGETTGCLIIKHAETLDKDGNFYTTNLRTAKATDTYVYGKDMEGQLVKPHFTFHGYRYIAIEGLEEEVSLDWFTACVLHSDMRQIGSFETDNAKVNRLQSNIEWGQRSNFVDIPSDCPQRDERLGWTGDAQIFCATGAYNFDTSLFFQKWLRDVAADSSEEYGVPHLVPNIVGPSVGTAVWSDCATIIPWQLYESYGDKGVLEEQYSLMKLWVDYIDHQSGDSVLWMNGFQRGDWLALDAPASRPELMSGGTDKNLVANIYYAVSARILRDAAKVLGNNEDVNKYGRLYEAIVEALNKEYVTSSGRLVSETQTACVLLLHFNLVKEAHRPRIIETLEENLINHKNHLTTGFVGTAYICHALSESGKHHIAEEVFLQPDFPGWFYAIEKGATTIWERWNSVLPSGDFDESGMNSLNHYSYGAIGDWMYRKVAGINPIEPGYKKIMIKPYLTQSMTEVSAELETMYGTIKSHWSCRDGRIDVDVVIPPNTTALICLPEMDQEIHVGSGSYHYDYGTKTSLALKTYSKKTSFSQILDDAKAAEVLYEILPDMKDNPMIGFIRTKTIGEMMIMNAEGGPMLEKLIETLNSRL